MDSGESDRLSKAKLLESNITVPWFEESAKLVVELDMKLGIYLPR